jgi:homoserine dehydrogenase
MSLLEFEPGRFRPKPRSWPAPVAPVARPPVRGGGVILLKFGSSVLRGPDDAPDVVSEIYRHVRSGAKVVAVVSALGGHTDQLLAQARRLGAGHDNRHLPRYVALGEEKACSLLAIGCDRVGLDAAVLGVRELGIRAEGPAEDAFPVGLEAAGLLRALAEHEVVLVPGFGAIGEHGRPVLLGRGGSDLTAVFLAAELGLDRVRLIKDVDGVYDGDPAEGAALRYARLGWAEARRRAGKLVQARALEVGEARGVEIEVAALGRGGASRIGTVDRPPEPSSRPAPRRVALAGCGVVGGGVLARLLARPDDWEVVGVLVRDCEKARDVAVPPGLLTEDADDLFRARPEILIEALSDGAAGEELIRRALHAGVHVASANKQAIVRGLPELKALAVANGATLAFSAAVGGGAPMLETLRRARAQGRIASIEAVLNGTVNFVLGALARGAGFDEALAAARAAGFAEEDPSSDLEGHDAAAKLRILAYEAFGAVLSDEETARAPLREGSAGDAQAWAALRQIARCSVEDGAVRAEVSLEIAVQDMFQGLEGEGNALKVVLDGGRVLACRGRGAGRWPTAESVLADLGDIARASIRV